MEDNGKHHVESRDTPLLSGVVHHGMSVVQTNPGSLQTAATSVTVHSSSGTQNTIPATIVPSVGPPIGTPNFQGIGSPANLQLSQTNIGGVGHGGTPIPTGQHHVHVPINYSGGPVTGPPISSIASNKMQQQQTSYLVNTGVLPSSQMCGGNEDEISVQVHVTNPPMSVEPPPPPPPQPVSETTSHSTSTAPEQRLKVEDALNYLDQVKYKFGNQPQVYNDFLDIMKEFKSQSIDTPGVIARVSHLFRGHPELIVGFNTFLPPGYKIEIQNSDAGGGYVVTTVQPGMSTVSSTSHSTTGTTQSTTLMQHTVPGLPMRASGTLSHGMSQGVYGSSVNNGRTSPVTVPANLASSSTTYEGPNNTPAFTHSFSSPFVQSAFPSLQSQPVEFNHAINYVNKIKNRFQAHPDKYKQFLEILHTYQKEQRNLKEGLPPSAKHLTEHEVYTQVAKLFENQEDLLQEFGQFLPDATSSTQPIGVKRELETTKKNVKLNREFNAGAVPQSTKSLSSATGGNKRPTMITQPQTAKKIKMSSFRDISLAEAGKHGTLNEFAFFDKVRQNLKNGEAYNNFLRCLFLFNEELISRSEVLQLVTPFLGKTPDLYAYFREFVGHADNSNQQYEAVSHGMAKQDKLTDDQALEIDFSSCKRLGASYCALPADHVPPRCNGRTPLCKEVLNDVWVSFPTWSEDSTFVTSRKTTFEEYIYRCEDERFELDVVIETNASTIRVLEAVSKKMARLSPEELLDFKLDDCLGGTSPTIHQRAVRRLYGDKATDIIEGLKKNPGVAVPLVLRRLKSKEDEWRDAQKGFNKIWREQVERFYLKSLDHQGITFKQTDMRSLRSKALISEIETIYEERHELATNDPEGEGSAGGPHMQFQYRERAIFDDACNLILHHVRRQSGIQKEDKRKIKQILKHFVPDLVFHPRMELSDDEVDDYSHDEHEGQKTPDQGSNGKKENGKRNGNSRKGGNAKCVKSKNHEDIHDASAGNESAPAQESRRTMAKKEMKQICDSVRNNDLTNPELEENVPTPTNSIEMGEEVNANGKPTDYHPLCYEDESYRLFFVNNCWYVFLRLHQILCERLTKVHETAMTIIQADTKEAREQSSNSAAVGLHLRPRDEDMSDYYPTFLEMVQNLLDGNMDGNVYEDTLREMFGIHAYIAYTMDKVVANAVRQLQTLVSDETCQKCMELYVHASKQGATGGLCSSTNQRLQAEVAYQKRAEKAYAEENCVKVVFYEKSSRMSMELLECPEPTSPQRNEVDERAKWTTYVENFVEATEEASQEADKEIFKRPVFLPRNLRKRKKDRPELLSEPEAITVKSEPVIKIEKEDDSEAKSPTEDEELQTPLTEAVPTVLSMIDRPPTPILPPLEVKIEKPDILDTEDDCPSEAMDAESLESIVKSNCANAKSKYIIEGNLQCQFNPNTYKMVFVVNSENIIYLKGALKRARETHKEVSKRLNEAFGRWHQNWIEDNVTEDQITQCEDWFLSAKTSTTKVISNNDVNKAPYRPVNRYKVSPGVQGQRGSVNSQYWNLRKLSPNL